MSFKILLFTTLTSLIFSVSASPHPLTPRDSDSNNPNIQISTDWTYGKVLNWSPQWPTCGNDVSLTTEIGLSTNTNVDVHNDCDAVIDAICRAADFEASSDNNTMLSLSETHGTCEGHILFNTSTKLGPTVLNYNSCVKGFQGITESCMLIDDPNNKNDYASVGHQFGVQNVQWVEKPLDGLGQWEVSTQWTQGKTSMPGSMIGAAGVFGKVDGYDALKTFQSWEPLNGG